MKPRVLEEGRLLALAFDFIIKQFENCSPDEIRNEILKLGYDEKSSEEIITRSSQPVDQRLKIVILPDSRAKSYLKLAPTENYEIEDGLSCLKKDNGWINGDVIFKYGLICQKRNTTDIWRPIVLSTYFYEFYLKGGDIHADRYSKIRNTCELEDLLNAGLPLEGPKVVNQGNHWIYSCQSWRKENIDL